MDQTSMQLLRAWVQGEDAQAIERFLGRYVDRLLGMLKRRISRKLGRRIDPEDVLQSACKSFVMGVRSGRIDIEAHDQPGQLLTKIVVRKLFKQFEWHQGAARRSIDREQAPAEPEEGRGRFEALSPEPGPDELAAVADEVDLLLKGFPETHREMIVLHLQ